MARLACSWGATAVSVSWRALTYVEERYIEGLSSVSSLSGTLMFLSRFLVAGKALGVTALGDVLRCVQFGQCLAQGGKFYRSGDSQDVQGTRGSLRWRLIWCLPRWRVWTGGRLMDDFGIIPA